MTEALVEPAAPGDRAGWQPTACILCECNCGVEVKVSADGLGFDRVRGDKAHPTSQGYTCEKALRLDHYQRGRRLLQPQRRRSDGTFEAIDWDTAIREVADRFAAIRDQHGGESIFYYGGGGQGNHLGGAYSGATLRALGVTYKANALSQEKTGEFWVNGHMFGGAVRADFEHCDVAVFVGKNPWHSHGIAAARSTLKEIANDPARSLVVIDPRRSETAELADLHLQVKPGTDAFCLSAMVAVIVQEGVIDAQFVSDHVDGVAEILAAFEAIDIDEYAAHCGVDPALLRAAARRIASADRVAVSEDLGIQMNRHSTMNSWLEKLLWVLTGNFARVGTQYMPTPLVPFVRSGAATAAHVSPVVGATIINGLVPCNVIPDEILTDHPRRYRAMLVESGNPAHSLADSVRMNEALEALDLLVVIDVSMTETARRADYVLPAPSQFEKFEATFFNFEFPRNSFHLRHPVVAAPNGPLPEPEIHARLVEALGMLPDATIATLRDAAQRGRLEFGAAFLEAIAANPMLGALAPVVLYRTLGPTLRHDAASAAVLWGAAHRCAMSNETAVRRAGFGGEGLELGEALFDALIDAPHGVTFAVDEWDDVWRKVATPSGRINVLIPELLAELATLTDEPPLTSGEFPLLLSAGERRAFTANTIIRDPAWRKRDRDGALRLSPADAAACGLTDGGVARLVTHRGSAEVVVAITDVMQPGHISLPNGMGLDEAGHRVGAAPNELTSGSHRDQIAGTPWHKSVPARLERVAVVRGSHGE